MAGKHWTEDEIKILIENYPEMGTKYCASLLSNRTEKSINVKVSRLGLKYTAGWTKNKLQFLKENYKKLGLSECANILCLKKDLVQKKAQLLGLTNKTNKWGAEDLTFLVENYAKLGSKECASILGRKRELVRNKAYELKITDPISYDTMSNEDILCLVKTYKLYDVFNYTKELPNAPTVLRRLNKKHWHEVLELANLPPNTGTRDPSGSTLFYIIEFRDIDGTIFKKYGVTQSSLKYRYKNRTDYTILLEKHCDNYLEAISLEKDIGRVVNKYRPKDVRFYSKGHGGYTECFIDYINKPRWIDHG